VLITFEINREKVVIDEYLEEIHRTINIREQEEKISLEKNVRFNTEILSSIAARFLYDFDIEELNRSLPPYMRYPEILAIQVWNEDGEPVAAVWKAPNITTGDELPDDLKPDEQLSIQVDSVLNDEKVGRFQVYYTDSTLREKIKSVKEAAVIQEENFRKDSRSRLIRAIVGQAIGVFFILLTLMICLIFSLRALILKPLLKTSKVARQLSDFDLTVSMKANTQDEIGRLFLAINEMVRSFKKVVSLVQHSGQRVFSSASELSVSAKLQEATMANQVESADNAVKSIEDISNVAAELVQTMRQVSSMSQETTEYANRGQSDLFRMEEAMRSMENASISISEKLEVINEKAETITTVVTTINKVSEQTNLLSLNASIEAEKAGEYGRGFSVVAREIRRLADQTAVSTLNIERMVQEMQLAVSSGIMEMDKFVTEVQRSSEDVGKISMQLTLIIDQVQALSPNFENVNVAMGNQSENAQKITNVMENLSEEMLRTKDSLHETYAAIEQLNEAARDLQDEVSQFKVN